MGIQKGWNLLSAGETVEEEMKGIEALKKRREGIPGGRNSMSKIMGVEKLALNLLQSSDMFNDNDGPLNPNLSTHSPKYSSAQQEEQMKQHKTNTIITAGRQRTLRTLKYLLRDK